MPAWARGLGFDYQFADLAVAIVVIFFGRLGLSLAATGLRWPAIMLGVAMIAAGVSPMQLPSGFLHWFVSLGGVLLVVRSVWPWANRAVVAAAHTPTGRLLDRIGTQGLGWLLLAIALVLPVMPFADQKTMDLAVLVLTYVMLGWGLNIVVGLAGLLDLGYVAFYAVGAYAYALLSTQYGLGFWVVLPLAGMFAATFGLVLGFSGAAPARRLSRHRHPGVRRDHPPGAAETGSISPTARPASARFPVRPCSARYSPRRRRPGGRTVSEMLGLTFSGIHRLIFLYYIILGLALVTNLFTQRMRRLPVGRAWEALREDETACKALGINPTNTKLTAFAVGAMFAGFAGSFFAAKQRFVSPESFTFIESAIILAIVVLGGMGSQVGVVLAAVLLIACRNGSATSAATACWPSGWPWC